ncbi:hypothetical protein GFS24_03660 [Chitinophaga sp. SYP-B3965]|uniref:hypothetical protein n=1 Tax=Chitinophaga sp. SYP-B3965 TaxID=2663120 RepID=UPI001299DBAE|nr:hypothetical protein [Chitinophaga sp. SYP-B3965]MRG44193.1 hypothetical protein [Chitinophaga sp. SYP-B3965]
MTKYKIMVSEPWDFEGPAGANLIIGNIVKKISPLLIVFESDHLLNFGSFEGRILILKPRYEKEVLSDENSFEGIVGGAIFLSDNYEYKDIEYLEKNSKYVFIGSLREN